MPKSELEELREQALAVTERLRKAEEQDAQKTRVYNSEELSAGSWPGEKPDSRLPNLYNPDLRVGPQTGYRAEDVVRDKDGTRLVGKSARVFDVDTLIERSGGGEPGSKERFMYEMRKNPNYNPPPEVRSKYTDPLPGYAKLPVEKVWRDEERSPRPKGIGLDKKENPEEGVASVPVVKRPGLPKAESAGMFDKKEDKKEKKKK